MTDLLYRVVSALEWGRALEAGRVPLGAADQRDGFVHLSTVETVLQTAGLYFSPDQAPVALEISADGLVNEVRWEEVASRGGERFPHLYGPGIPLEAVVATLALVPDGSGGYSLGKRVERVG